MGFAANFLTVASTISQVYDIDLQINNLEQQKLAIASMTDMAADRESAANQRLMGIDPKTGRVDPRRQDRFNQMSQTEMMQLYSRLSQGDPGSRDLKRYLSQMEKRIDQKLEQMKAIRTALNSRKEEFQKYIQENIKSAFTNRYMGG